MKRVISLLLCAVMTISVPFCICASAASTGELQSRKSALESERAVIEQRIEKLKQQTDSYEELAAQYKQKMAVLQKELDLVNAQVSEATTAYESVVNKISSLQSDIQRLKQEIKQTKSDIEFKEQEISVYYDSFKERMKAIYISGSYSTLQALLESDDLSTFLIRLQMTSSVAKLDKAQMDLINEDIEQFNKLNESLEKDRQSIVKKRDSLKSKESQLKTRKDELQKLQSECTAKKEEISGAQAQTEQAISTLQAKTGKYEDDLTAYDNEIAQAIKEIEAANTTKSTTAASSGSSGSGGSTTAPSAPSSGSGDISLIYPVPGHTTIYCGFYGYQDHGGIDFSDSTINGATVVAAQSGQVIIKKELNYSYGHYIVIYHGQFGSYYYATCYAHMSSINSSVGVGTRLARGQSVGKVGQTGNATGPHLHFELRRYNSNLTTYTRIDPTGYLS